MRPTILGVTGEHQALREGSSILREQCHAGVWVSGEGVFMARWVTARLGTVPTFWMEWFTSCRTLESRILDLTPDPVTFVLFLEWPSGNANSSLRRILFVDSPRKAGLHPPLPLHSLPSFIPFMFAKNPSGCISSLSLRASSDTSRTGLWRGGRRGTSRALPPPLPDLAWPALGLQPVIYHGL